MEQAHRLREITHRIAQNAQRKELSGAIAAFQQLYEEGLTPTIYSHAALINAHATCANMRGAIAACVHMMASGLQLNTVVLTTLIKGYTNSGDVKSACGLLEGMTDGGAAGHLDGVPGLILAACHSICPDLRAVNTALRGCVRVGMARTAFRLYRRMESAWHIEPDVTTYRLMARVMAMSLDARSLHQLVERLAAESTDLDMYTQSVGEGGEDGNREPVCMFWQEGRNSCPRGKRCRFLHPAHILQVGQASAPRRLDLAISHGHPNPPELFAEADGCQGEREGTDMAGARAEFLTDICFLEAHAHTLRADWDVAMAALKRAERWHAQAQCEAMGGDGEGRTWYVQLALRETKLELNRLGTFLRSSAARAVRSDPGSTAPLRDRLRTLLGRTFLFDQLPAHSAAVRLPNTRGWGGLSKRPGDVVVQRLFDTLREAYGLDRACNEGTLESTRRCLKAFAEVYATRLSAHAHRFRFDDMFGDGKCEPAMADRAPLHVEVCSGNGDWVVAQAVSTSTSLRWVAMELRFDRVFQILSRALSSKCSNIALIGGDAAGVLSQCFPIGCVAHVFVNFPEPPHHTGADSAESAVELLTDSFFRTVHRVLGTGSTTGTAGRLTILSDSHGYITTLARTLDSAVDAGKPLFASMQAAVRAAKHPESVASEWGTHAESFGRITVHRAVPGRAQGHHVPTRSYFDRFWEHGHHDDRYFIDVFRI